MNRTLSLVLDEEGKISLTLFTGTNQQIDEYTMKTFKNSEEIRTKYQQQISAFLEENQEYVNSIEQQRNQTYRGRVVLLEAVEKGTDFYLIEQRVLYKDSLLVAKTAMNSSKVMNVVACIDSNGKINPQLYKRFDTQIKKGKFQLSPFVNELIKRPNYPTKTNLKNVQQWLKNSKESYYEKIRLLVSGYTYARKLYPALKTMNAIAKEHSIKQENNKLDNTEEVERVFVNVDGFSYPIDDVPFDNEELLTKDTAPFFDGLLKK